MTPRQIELARHALGLPNAYGITSRNRFYADLFHPDFKDWLAMNESGFAVVNVVKDSHRFELTRAGALAALLPGEALDPEDIPILRDSDVPY